MSLRVLIVDDSLTVRMDLAEAFAAAGFEAQACATLAEARTALGGGGVGLVVLDVMLPDGDGIDFLGELRATPETAAMPVLMLTGEIEVKDRVRGLRSGANDYVGKPYDARRVLARARDLLGAGEDEAAPILVIDDSPTFRASLRENLETSGYRVVEAGSGREGLAVLAERRPAAVIVDGVMPDLDGASVIRRIRLDTASRDLPCVLLTASEDATDQVKALEAGADAFVRKDEAMDLILARLAAVTRRLTKAPDRSAGVRSGGRRILAVDDSPTYLNALADALREEGYEVSLARSGEEALDLLAVQPVDCVLMDLMMPGIGGKEACRRIKAAPGPGDAPLILLTAHEDRAVMLEGLGAGADDYIAKSSGFEIVAARVLAQIRRKEFEDDNRRYREELHRREIDASRERAARLVAETRAALVDELERQVEARTKELETTILERRHAERMASIGMLSASIAHEINNPLAVVIGNLEFACQALAGGDAETPTGPLGEALDAAERVREIVRDLRIFSRSEADEEMAAVDLHAVLSSAIRMATNEIRHRATLVRQFDPVPAVVGNESRLGQVFLNLIVNAAQAMPVGKAKGNEIRVSTHLETDGVVAVEVADTGVGIPADKLASVFDPFFTTKPAGVGTGLGLAISRRIVTESGGDISVTSREGLGTTFRVELQRAAIVPTGEVAAAARETSEPPTVGDAPLAPARSRILVVDDEPALCRTIERILAPDHDVLTLTSARQALALIGEGRRFDAILSDVMMPEMTGMEFGAALAATAPRQAARMLFMTGGAFEPDAAGFLGRQTNPLIEKPFRPSVLRRTLEAALLALGPADRTGE